MADFVLGCLEFHKMRRPGGPRSRGVSGPDVELGMRERLWQHASDWPFIVSRSLVLG